MAPLGQRTLEVRAAHPQHLFCRALLRQVATYRLAHLEPGIPQRPEPAAVPVDRWSIPAGSLALGRRKKNERR